MQMSLPKTSVVSYEYKNPVQAYAKHTAGVNWRPPLNVRLKGTPVVIRCSVTDLWYFKGDNMAANIQLIDGCWSFISRVQTWRYQNVLSYIRFYRTCLCINLFREGTIHKTKQPDKILIVYGWIIEILWEWISHDFHFFCAETFRKFEKFNENQLGP